MITAERLCCTCKIPHLELWKPGQLVSQFLALQQHTSSQVKVIIAKAPELGRSLNKTRRVQQNAVAVDLLPPQRRQLGVEDGRVRERRLADGGRVELRLPVAYQIQQLQAVT